MNDDTENQVRAELQIAGLSFEPDRVRDGGGLGARHSLFRIKASTGGYTNVRDRLLSGERLETTYREDAEIVERGETLEVWQDLEDVIYWWAKVKVSEFR